MVWVLLFHHPGRDRNEMTGNARIESLGIYTPPGRLTTDELLDLCRHRPRLNLERITGIRERRVAEGEYAVDLGVRAAERALEMSRYSAADLGMVICTSISKYNREQEIDFDPATSVAVRHAIGASNALNFDIVNACAGMFNGILVMESFLRTGVIRCGMVVSGEYNWPLTDSATREIRHTFDGQLASLTLGDAGAALIIDRIDDDRFGFHYLEMVTGAKHNQYCYSIPSQRGPGGILITNAVGLQRKGAEHFPQYLKKAVERTGWSLDDVDYGIAHQASVRVIKRGVKEAAKFIGEDLPHDYLYNCDVYGNTTTTSHFIVLDEFMRNGTIDRDHKILFVSGASGIVITHATYTMDDLPERYRAHLGGEESDR